MLSVFSGCWFVGVGGAGVVCGVPGVPSASFGWSPSTVELCAVE